MGLKEYRSWDSTGKLDEITRRLPRRYMTDDLWDEVDRLVAEARKKKTVRAYGRGLGKVLVALGQAAAKGR